jgi:Putative transposase
VLESRLDQKPAHATSHRGQQGRRRPIRHDRRHAEPIRSAIARSDHSRPRLKQTAHAPDIGGGRYLPQVPPPIAAIALQNKATVYDLLLKTATQTIRTVGADPKHLGAETGMIAILHTWGQTLTHHHAHFVVPSGGLTADGRWIGCRPNFFLPVHARSRLYRRLSLERRKAAHEAGHSASSAILRVSPNLQCLPAILNRSPMSIRLCTPNAPSEDCSKFWTIWVAIPIASPSPTIVFSPARMARSVLNGKTIERTTNPR